QFGLDIVAIQAPPEGWFNYGDPVPHDTSKWTEAYVGDAPYVNSANDTLVLDGIDSVAEAKKITTEWLVANGHGEATVTYKLRDWLFSRQRYWGEPFPVVYDEAGRAHTLPDHMLPLT